MAEVLETTDIDTLLAAVDPSLSGRTGADALPSAESVERFEGAESDSRRSWDNVRGREVHTYDFKRPERVSKDQMRALGGIHESFARNLGASLSGLLRTIVEVRMATIEQLTYSEFIHSLPNPTNFNLLKAEPLQGQMCLEVSPLIIYPIIDRLLGGSSAELFIPERPLTLIELRLIRRITDRALQCLTEVWSTLVPIKFVLSDVESNPHLVQLVAPNEVVVVIGFEVKMEPRSGTLSLCLPFNVVEPIMPKLASQGWVAYQRRPAAQGQRETIGKVLGKAELGLTAFLAETTMTVRDLLTLRPGDILQTTKPADSELMIRIEGRNKFRGRLGKQKDVRAIRITRRVCEEEKL